MAFGRKPRVDLSSEDNEKFKESEESEDEVEMVKEQSGEGCQREILESQPFCQVQALAENSSRLVSLLASALKSGGK